MVASYGSSIERQRIIGHMDLGADWMVGTGTFEAIWGFLTLRKSADTIHRSVRIISFPSVPSC